MASVFFSLHSGPGYVSASESITRRKSPRASFPHLRYYKLTLQPNYGASYYGPGAYLQEHYTPIFLNPSLLRTVYGITVTIYYRADCVSFSQPNVNVNNLIRPRRNTS